MLFGQVNGEFLHHFSCIARQGAKQGTVAIHDDETKFLIRLEQFAECLGMKLVVAQVQRSVDGFEGFEIDVDLSFLSFGGQYFATVDDQAIRRDFAVELQPLLGGGDGGKDTKTVDSRLDIGRGSKLFGQHLCRRLLAKLEPIFFIRHDKP